MSRKAVMQLKGMLYEKKEFYSGGINGKKKGR